MKSADLVEKQGAPVSASTDTASITTRAPEPLSYIPATVLVVVMAPSGAMAPCSSIDCSPCTSMAGS
jgi:hypothetical protein